MRDDPFPEELIQAGAGTHGAEKPGEIPPDPPPEQTGLSRTAIPAPKPTSDQTGPQTGPQGGPTKPRIPAHIDGALMPLEEAQLKTPSLMRDVTWVAEHLGVKGVTFKSAPSSLAWGIYKWANANQMNQTQFWTRVMPSKSALEASARFEDVGSSIEQLIDRFSGHHAYVERKFDD